MTVFVVYVEQQNGEPELVAVCTNEARAKEIRQKHVADWHKLGRSVYGEPPPGVDLEDDEEYDDPDWDVDVHVEAIELDESLPTAAEAAQA